MVLLIILLYLGGLFFYFVGAVGLLRLPDALCRLHATSLTDTMGSTLILAGGALQVLPNTAGLKVVLIWLLILLLNPTVAHLIGQYAWSGKQEKPGDEGGQQHV